ncbi:MAG: AAA family ATPase [Acidobacteriota bacterium]
MTTPLVLDSLDIQGFRPFDHFRVERLGRVTLFTGKNNVGKSSLLEAIWLYAYQGAVPIIWQILESRDEGRAPRLGSPRNFEDPAPVVKNLFHGRKEIRDHLGSIQIGPVDSPDKALTVALGWYKIHIDEEGGRELKPLQFEDFNTADQPILALAVRVGSQPEVVYRFDRRYPESEKKSRCIFVSANGLNRVEVGQLWDDITLTNLEEDVLSSLRIIAPEVERVNLIDNADLGRDRGRIAKTKISVLPDPVPLRSLGEGMNRLFGMALALVNAKDGVLLIDEIESGLHYSVQPDVWRLVFETAHRLNVQVFATTHSWDCIEAFQQAADENKQEEGILIRLENKRGRIVATEFDERRLGIATREEIEVR